MCAGFEQYLSGIDFPIDIFEGDCNFDKPLFYFEHGDFLIPAVSCVLALARATKLRLTDTNRSDNNVHAYAIVRNAG